MIPIFEQGHGNGIGHSFDNFLKRFTEICNDHLENGRAKSFAFIIYDFDDKHIKTILSDQGGFTKLDRLSGKDLSIFYLHSGNRRLLNAFNGTFLDAFEIDLNEHNLPFVLFFKFVDNEVVDLEIFELEQTNLMHAFNELYVIIKNYIDRPKENMEVDKQLKTNKIKNIWKSVKKIAVDKFLDWLLEKGAKYIGEYL